MKRSAKTKMPNPRDRGAPADMDWVISNCLEQPHDALPQPCLLWLGSLSYDGYPLAGGEGLPERRVHRLTYHMTYGSIPAGKAVDHLCHNPACVNPAHLELVDDTENNRRKRSYLGSKPCTKCGSKVEVRRGKRHCVPCSNRRFKLKYERKKQKNRQLTLEMR